MKDFYHKWIGLKYKQHKLKPEIKTEFLQSKDLLNTPRPEWYGNQNKKYDLQKIINRNSEKLNSAKASNEMAISYWDSND